MYILIIESLLGLRLEVDKLFIEPCLPIDWEKINVHYRYRETTYHISIVQKHDNDKKTKITVDGIAQIDTSIPLADDHKDHTVEVIILSQ